MDALHLPRIGKLKMKTLIVLLVLVLLDVQVSEGRKHEKGTGSASIPTMEKANCPSDDCECTATKVECIGNNARSTDVFLSLDDTFYPDLDTLIIEGNNFGELDPISLFAPDVEHRRLSKLSLKKNNITYVHGNVFEAMKNVQELDLSMNNISKVEGDPLGMMEKLTTLNLEGTFNTDLEANEFAALLRKLFVDSRNEFAQLSTLRLDGNGLVYLPKEMFCHLPALETLALRNNSLQTFSNPDAGCLSSLGYLDLSDNDLRQIAGNDLTLFTTLENKHRLNKVNFSENVFECNCYLKDFVNWFKDTDIVIDVENTNCFKADPENLEGEELRKINADVLNCPESDGSYLHTVYIFVTLATIGLCLLMACVLYTNRRMVCRKAKDFGNGKARFRVVGGYEPLDKEPEVKAEFV